MHNYSDIIINSMDLFQSIIYIHRVVFLLIFNFQM